MRPDRLSAASTIDDGANLAAIRARIDERGAGRRTRPAEIRLLPVSKTVESGPAP